MIFYIALDKDDHQVLCGTQAEAKAINKNFEQIEIPTDKAGLMTTYQEALDTIHTLALEKDELRQRLEQDNPAQDLLPEEKMSDTTKALVNPPMNQTAMTLTIAEEFIQQANPQQLASLADNVCWRIKELSNELLVKETDAG